MKTKNPFYGKPDRQKMTQIRKLLFPIKLFIEIIFQLKFEKSTIEKSIFKLAPTNFLAVRFAMKNCHTHTHTKNIPPTNYEHQFVGGVLEVDGTSNDNENGNVERQVEEVLENVKGANEKVALHRHAHSIRAITVVVGVEVDQRRRALKVIFGRRNGGGIGVHQRMILAAHHFT